MKTIKIFLLTFIMFQSSANFADVGEVYQWKAFPGKTQQMLENMQEAAKIHEAEGAVVAIDLLNIGSEPLVNYVLRWDNSKDYAAFKDQANQSDEWLEYWAWVNLDPTGEMVASFAANNLDQT